MSRLLLGTAGWLYPDWKGTVYPRPAPRGFDPLALLAESVDLVEVNATFYAPVKAESAAAWVERVAAWPEFRFVVKAWERFTHHGPALPSDEERGGWRAMLEPLAAAGRLVCVLAQFPPSVRASSGTRDHLLRVRDALAPHPVAAEFRHRSWTTPDVLAFLEQHRIAFVNIDQPQGRDTVPPTAHVTAPFSYTRLHGRNAQAWFSRDAGRDERYHWHYADDTLAAWAARIRMLQERTGGVDVVVGNNHFEGEALDTVLRLAHLLRGERVVVPETLLARRPELAAIHRPAPGRLF